VPEARVRQRFRQQQRIAELVADSFFERIQSAPSYSKSGRLTRVCA
jgi:hypothetical protein